MAQLRCYPGETRFSPLKLIDTGNVSRLGLAWTYDVGEGGGPQEATPLEWNGAVYSITNWSIVFAVDARTGREKWRWDPQVNQDAVRLKICCGVVNRGIAIYDGKIIAPVIDGRLIALDAVTGKPVWESRVEYPQHDYTITVAPRIAKGDPAKGFESEAMRKAAASWSGDWWKLGGGGSIWDGIAYDPEADLVYVGTGNGGPWPEALRKSEGKDNLYVCSIVAVKPETGELKWYFQMVPGDEWDYDGVQQLMIADVTIQGQLRKVIMQANKNGFYYVLDRFTG